MCVCVHTSGARSVCGKCVCQRTGDAEEAVDAGPEVKVGEEAAAAGLVVS